MIPARLRLTCLSSYTQKKACLSSCTQKLAFVTTAVIPMHKSLAFVCTKALAFVCTKAWPTYSQSNMSQGFQ